MKKDAEGAKKFLCESIDEYVKMIDEDENDEKTGTVLVSSL